MHSGPRQVLSSGHKPQRYVRLLCEQLLPAEQQTAAKQLRQLCPRTTLLRKSLKDKIHADVFRIKKPKDSFNCLEQKGLNLLSSSTNSVAVAAISLAHLEE